MATYPDPSEFAYKPPSVFPQPRVIPKFIPGAPASQSEEEGWKPLPKE